MQADLEGGIQWKPANKFKFLTQLSDYILKDFRN